MTRIKTAGGRFEPDAPVTFFVAGAPTSLPDQLPDVCPYVLSALNDLLTAANMQRVSGWLEDTRTRTFLDSGIFALTNAHMRKHNTTMEQALSLAPDEIDGFNELLPFYVDTCKRLAPQLWGYCELDQGGRDNKRRTREYLESEGLRPIPVYHPLNDGWDYLDELLERYDRIAVGNTVHASAGLRRELLLTVWERVRRVRGRVWLHVLGFTPNPLLLAAPFNSCDSTEYVLALQYGSEGHKARSMLAGFGGIADPAYSADQQATLDPERGHRKASRLGAYIAHSDLRCWRRVRDDAIREFPELGAVYPKPLPREQRTVRRPS